MIDNDLIALTMGEPAGISGELTLKAWLSDSDKPTFFAIDDPDRMLALSQSLNINVPIEEISDPKDASQVFLKALPVLREKVPHKVSSGQPNYSNTPAILSSIERAVDFAKNNRVTGMVTNPVNKTALYASGFKYPGQTEFLSALSGQPPSETVMMLASKTLRISLVTVHIAISEIANNLNIDAITAVGRITYAALQKDFNILMPKITVAALNPHAGENKSIGKEEANIIQPAVEILQREGINIDGPYPADTLFHNRARQKYDAVICMYHDQGLIPLKTIDFANGVNITLGLPFVRTSPDHGTAFDIAGKGYADESSLLSAMRLASEMGNNRKKNFSKTFTSNQ